MHAEDQMDDGTPIKLAVTIDRRDGSALFDFEGTGERCAGARAGGRRYGSVGRGDGV